MSIYDRNFQRSINELCTLTSCQDEIDIEDFLPMKQDISHEMYSKSTNPINVATHLINIMPLEVFEDEAEYADIICAMKNTFPKDESHRGLEVLLNHLKSKEKICDKIKKDWESSLFDENKYTHRAIGEILLRRYPKIYLIWHSFWISGTYSDIIDNICKNNSSSNKISLNDISELMYKLFWLEYIYINGKWYTLDQNNILIECGTAVSSMIIDMSERNRQWRYKNETHTTDDVTNNRDKIGDVTYCQAFEKFHTFISNMKSASIESNLKARFSFLIKKEFNNDPERILWKNGYMTVAKSTGISLVGPHIEDLYTMTTSCNFPSTKPKQRDIDDLFNWLYQAYPEGTHEFMLTDWASFLHGINIHRKNRSWIGVGANSKSRLIKLIESMLGDYCVTAPQCIIMEQQNNGNATTEINNIMKARVACINEPQIGSHLSAEQLKIISGSDRLFIRKLYQEGASCQNMSKIIIVCNNIPLIKNADKPTRDRFEAHPHLGKWCSDPEDPEMKKKYKYLYKIDSTFDDKIPHLAGALAWILFYDYYPKYVEWVKDHANRKLPKLFADEQERQWRRVCKLSEYVFEKVIKYKDPTCYVTLKNITDRYIHSNKTLGSCQDQNFISDSIRDMCLADKLIDDKVYGYCIKQQGNTIFYNTADGKSCMKDLDESEE